MTNKWTINPIIESGVLPTLVKMLNSSQIIIINPTLRILGNITHGCDEDTQKVIDSGVLQPIYT